MPEILIKIYPNLKYILPVPAMVVIVIYVLIGKRQLHLLRGFVAAILLGLALLAVGNFTNLGRWSGNSYLNANDFYHYYTGSKYTRELGYSNLYPASLVADDLTNRKYERQTIREVDKAWSHISVEKVLAEKGRYKGLFKGDRWQQFVKDIQFFKKRLTTNQWNYALGDNGYNATPVWTMVGGILSNIISTDNKWGMTVLALLDVFLILAALACVWRAFGYRTLLLMVVFFGTSYIITRLHPKGAFLRTDWIMCLVMAICMLKLKHYKTAGALTAYAALSRIFPAIFIFGIGVKFIYDLVRKRSINRRYLAYFASFTCTICIFVIASIAYGGGFEIWKEFASKIITPDGDELFIRGSTR